MSEAATPAEGPLSVDQAIAALAPEPEVEAAPEAPAEAAEEPQEPQGETKEPEEAEVEAETPDEAEETEAEEAEPVVAMDPPKYWSQEAKAKFAELPSELQAVVLEQEGPREAATAKAKADAAAQVEAAQKELAGVQTLAQQLSEFLPQAVKTFQQRWGEPDWTAVAEERGVEQAFLLKSQYDAEQRQLAQVQHAEQAARTQAQKAFVETEWRLLAEIEPDLAPDASDPTKGADKRHEVTKYLLADGIPQDAIAQISAREMRIARKAMLYDKAQAAMKAKPPPKPATAAPKAATVKPSAAVAQSSPQSALAQAQSRFNLHPTQANAQALLVAREAQRQ